MLCNINQYDVTVSLDDVNGLYIFSLLPHILVSKVQSHDSNCVSALPDVHFSKFSYNQNQNLNFGKEWMKSAFHVFYKYS